MADDKEQSHESAILGQLWKKTQMERLNAFSGVHDKYTKSYKNRLLTSEGVDAAEGLGRQARLLNEANASLEGIGGKQRFDSEASFAAATERGIQKKMRALNMLDQASEDVTYDPMVAEFVDPVTGERVAADTYDYNSDRALRDAMYQDFKSAGYQGEDQLRAAKALAAQQDSRYHSTQGTQGNEHTERHFKTLFGDENAQTMQDAWQSGRLSMTEVTNTLSQIRNSVTASAQESFRAGVQQEIEGRQAGAIDTAEAHNTQQSLAAQKGTDQANAAAEAKSEIRKSIQSDKQTLARQSAGRVGGGRKAIINFGDEAGGSRPV